MAGSLRFQSAGFTLIEAIMVMVITGIVAGMVAVFIQKPVEGYFDAVRRAELSDVADTALRRLSRDIGRAVPNSVRLTSASGNPYIEFLPTSDGGRYRAEGTSTTQCAAAGDALDFAAADTCFEILGPAMTFTAGDQIVIFNLGIAGADVYSGNTAAADVRRAYNGSTGSPVQAVVMTSAAPLPFESPSKRFQVVPAADLAVSYGCVGAGASATGDGTGQLIRHSAYGINAAQTAPPSGGQTAVLADNVSRCSIDYAAGVTQRSGLVSIELELRKADESVSLYHEIHVSNVP